MEEKDHAMSAPGLRCSWFFCMGNAVSRAEKFIWEIFLKRKVSDQYT